MLRKLFAEPDIHVTLASGSIELVILPAHKLALLYLQQPVPDEALTDLIEHFELRKYTLQVFAL